MPSLFLHSRDLFLECSLSPTPHRWGPRSNKIIGVGLLSITHHLSRYYSEGCFQTVVLLTLYSLNSCDLVLVTVDSLSSSNLCSHDFASPSEYKLSYASNKGGYCMRLVCLFSRLYSPMPNRWVTIPEPPAHVSEGKTLSSNLGQTLDQSLLSL